MKPRERSAFTLLELLIALALLGGLLLLAWSIMGTLRLAESRTEGLAGRVRLIQSARTLLEDDLQHLVGGIAGTSDKSGMQAGMPLGAFSTSGALSSVTPPAGASTSTAVSSIRQPSVSKRPAAALSMPSRSPTSTYALVRRSVRW